MNTSRFGRTATWLVVASVALGTLTACKGNASANHETRAGLGQMKNPCRLVALAETRTIYAAIGRAQARGARECDYYPASGPWARVAYLAIQVRNSDGHSARRFVATGAPAGAMIGPVAGIGDSAAYQVTPPTPEAHLPPALVTLAAVKGSRVLIITFMGPLDDFPGQAPGQAGFARATRLLARAAARL